VLGGGLRIVGSATSGVLGDTGALSRLFVSACSRLLLGPLRGETPRIRATVEQGIRAGNRSLPLVSLICVLTGMIMALQSAYQLEKMGAIELVPNLVAISMIRELAPLLTAIIVTGRYGSAIAAELGTMKVSQEIDALVVMGFDPVQYLVVPRLFALAIVLPCLTVFADVVGILGGMIVAVGALGMGAGSYLSLTFDVLVLEDVYTGLVKSVAFALIIGLIGCHQGLETHGGAEEVGRSTTTSVVRSIVLIIAADLFVTAIFFTRS
jgi:phospholipid/cholesterol/gamma-HCH transport system permease protein